MSVYPVPQPGGPAQPDVAVPEPGRSGVDQRGAFPSTYRVASEAAPTSVLDLVDRTLADTTRTANAAVIITTVSKGAAKVVLSVGVVLTAIIALAGTLIHFAGLGPGLGGAVAVGATTAVAGGRYLWNRRTAECQCGTGRRRKM